MNKVENTIEQYIKNNEKKYIRILYRVMPIYKGKNQIPTGVLIEAKSLNTEFSMCRFCYNIQEKVKFDYSDVRIINDTRIIGSRLPNLKRQHSERKLEKSKNINFVVNSKTKKYHLENCNKLKNVDPKFIKEITTKELSLKLNGYSACSSCFKDKK